MNKFTGGSFPPSEGPCSQVNAVAISLHCPDPTVLQGFQYSFLGLSRDIRDLILHLIGLLSTIVYRDFLLQT